MSIWGRVLIFAVVAIPLPLISGLIFGNWREVRWVWLGFAVLFTINEIGQWWSKRRRR